MLTREEWGFVLFTWILTNSMTWLFGWEMDTKYKLILPNVLVLVVIGLLISFHLMGL